MSKSEILCAILIILVGGLLIFGLVKAVQADPVIIEGTVVGLEYEPYESNTGIGIGIAPGGGVAPVVVSSSDDEDWFVVLKTGEKYQTFEVTPAVYYSLEVGDNIQLSCHMGTCTLIK